MHHDTRDFKNLLMAKTVGADSPTQLDSEALHHVVGRNHETPIAAMRKKTVWGRWHLDEARHVLQLHAPKSTSLIAEIGLPIFPYGCTEEVFNAWLGSWLQDVHTSRETSYKDVWDFVDAAQDIYVHRRPNNG